MSDEHRRPRKASSDMSRMVPWPSILSAPAWRPQIYTLTLLSLITVSAALTTVAPSASTIPASQYIEIPNAQQDLRHAVTSWAHVSWSLLGQVYNRARQGRWGVWDVVQLMAGCAAVLGITIWRQRSIAQKEDDTKISHCQSIGRSSVDSRTRRFWQASPKSDAESTDPGLLQKHSTFKSYTTSLATYTSIRTFYRPHPQADKLPSKPTPLPLLVFVHGLGGSLAQFSPILTSLVNVAPCLGIDLPGCGRSEFAPASWQAYTPKALAELIAVVVKEHCARNMVNQGVILIGHSLGCSLSVLVASSYLVSNQHPPVEVLAMVAICPQVTPPSDRQIALFKKLRLIPNTIFDLWRAWDRRGGPQSASVRRYVGENADIEVKKLQERFNRQSKTPVFRRMAWGAISSHPGSKVEHRGLPGLDVWGSLKLSLFLVAGEADSVTKADEIVKIGHALGKVERPRNNVTKDSGASSNEEESHTDATSNGRARHPSEEEKKQMVTSNTETVMLGDTKDPTGKLEDDNPGYSLKHQILKTSILPSPASHGLLYDSATYRTLAGLIHTFLYEHVDTRLSLGWQLQHLSTEGKWDVKNLAKWQAIRPVSKPIAGIFRAMKTLREIGDTHSPEFFVREWKGKIKAVIDISHESPVYDPKGLDEGGIEYHKFPTVSKIPPTPEEAKDFIKLVDLLRAQPPSTPVAQGRDEEEQPLIGVHCHYGFNRTGFFICCYLIEKEGYGVQQAIETFAASRPKGIKHAHFLDELSVRYCVGLKRAPTL